MSNKNKKFYVRFLSADNQRQDYLLYLSIHRKVSFFTLNSEGGRPYEPIHCQNVTKTKKRI